MTDAQMLPLELPEPEPSPVCWYCGKATAVLEVEHQLPKSRGGLDDGNTVHACAPCNDLKGPLSLEEFRRGLAERLGTEVVFAGEATPARPATPIAGRVSSLAGDRSVVRLDPAVGEELQAAWRYLRGTEDPRLTRRDLASSCIASGLDAMREERELGPEWPEPTLTLFDTSRPSMTARDDLAAAPRVPMARQHTKAPGELLDWARAGVEHRRANGEPELQLLDWIGDALRAALEADAARFPGYPTLDEALRRRYGTRDGS